MKFRMQHRAEDRRLQVFFELEYFDCLDMRLSELDRLMLRECEQSEAVSDKFLALELIVRRYEEAQARKHQEALG